GPSRSRTNGFFGAGTITTGMWHDIGGGESGFATPDPKDPNIVWSSASGYGALGGVVTRFNEQTRQFRHVEVWPELTTGHPASEVKYRFQWTFPLLISPHDHNTIFVTSQVVHRTTNGGQSWEVISPDLTLNDKSKQTKSGGLTPDNIGVEYANVIYAFEESPVKKGVFWAGTNDGQVQVSQDGAKTWANVTKNLPELPPLGTVRNIDASKWAEGKAYLTVDLHEVGNFQAYVYKTDNFGKTWKKITKGIDGGNLNYCRMIKEDPVRKGLLYLGTETKLFISFDDGENWQTFMSNLPHTPMYWIDVQEHFNDLVVGTYGRGIWILDDISPLQQMPQDTKTILALFNPHDTYRFQGITSTMQFFPEASSGQDPPYGAPINYWSGSELDSVKIHIINAAGDTVRSIENKAKPGINRVWWDLQSNPTTEIVFRTPPEAAPWFPMSESRTRKNPNFGRNTYLVPPGNYTVHLVAGGISFKSTINVIKDPHSEGTLDDIKAQTDFIIKARKDMNKVAEMVNSIELARRQLLDLNDALKAKDNKSMMKEISDMEKKLRDLENNLVQTKISGNGQDAVRWPAKIGEKLDYLTNTAGTADFKPSDPHNEVYEVLKNNLNTQEAAYNKLIKEEFVNFIKKLQNNNIGPVIIP
ncbi:MAG TPA: hypothetical protein VIS49_12635, partial [Cyclobacteriaceae bacterium]